MHVSLFYEYPLSSMECNASQLVSMISASTLQNTETYEAIGNLTNDPLAWKVSCQAIVDGYYRNDEEHFVLLVIIENYLQKAYPYETSTENFEFIKTWMNDWINKVYSNVVLAPTYLVNKVAHLFSLVFAADFPRRWPNFMQDIFLQRLKLDRSQFQFFYLKTLIAIDTEVVDSDISRTEQMLNRNTAIKDAMRELCINDVSQTWLSILENSDTKVKELCLEVIGSYADWIDINLVVNETIINLIMECTKLESLYEAAINALRAVLEKGMKSDEKLKLIKWFLNIFNEKKSLVINMNNMDSVENIGALVSSMGVSLILCYNHFQRETRDQIQARECIKVINTKLMPHILTVFAVQSYDALQDVVDFLRMYVALMKNHSLRTEASDILSKIINIAVKRFEVRDNSDLDDSTFIDYRKQLKSLLSAAGNNVPDLTITIFEVAIGTVCDRWRELEFPNIEASLKIAYAFSEIFNTNFARTTDDASTRAKNLLMKVLSTDVTHCGVSEINDIFFDMSCRYDKMLLADPTPLSLILEAFLDNRGLRHPSGRLRSRCSYLFCRFVKSFRDVISNHSQTILIFLTDFLCDSSADVLLGSEDCKNIYEAASILILHGSLSCELKEQYIGELLNLLMEKFVDGSERAKGAAENDPVHAYLCDIVSYCTRVTKPFAMIPCKSPVYTRMFSELIQLFLRCIPVERLQLMDAFRQFLHVMISCMNNEILPHIHGIFSKFLSSSMDLKLTGDFLILTNQLLVKFSTHDNYVGLNLPLLFNFVWNIQKSSCYPDNEDVIQDIRFLNRCYILFVSTLLGSKTLSSLIDHDSQFGGRLSSSILSVCSSIYPPTQKAAFSLVGKFFLHPDYHGVVEFIWNEGIIIALKVLRESEPGMSDAESFLMLQEVIRCLLAFRHRSLYRFNCSLQAMLPPAVALQFCTSLSVIETKEPTRDDLILLLKALRS